MRWCFYWFYWVVSFKSATANARTNKPILNTMILSLPLYWLVWKLCHGDYSSNYETSINENAPKDVMSFVRYPKREQCMERGRCFRALFHIANYWCERRCASLSKGKDKYEPAESSISYQYDEEHFCPALGMKTTKTPMRILLFKEERNHLCPKHCISCSSIRLLDVWPLLHVEFCWSRKRWTDADWLDQKLVQNKCLTLLRK